MASNHAISMCLLDGTAASRPLRAGVAIARKNRRKLTMSDAKRAIARGRYING
jgi:hypothetical protein